jgi:predicted NBD/HSP70 family sugar kinase
MCRCGQRGCLEAVVSVDTVRQQIAHSHPGVSVDGAALAELDDPLTRRILEEAGLIVGRVLADICTMLNPAAVILGGELGTAGPALRDGVASAIRRYVPQAVAAAVEVLPASLGERAELTGTLAMAASLVGSSA